MVLLLLPMIQRKTEREGGGDKERGQTGPARTETPRRRRIAACLGETKTGAQARKHAMLTHNSPPPPQRTPLPYSTEVGYNNNKILY